MVRPVNRLRGLLIVPVAAAAFLAAGCGGGNDETPSAVDWANSVCQAVSTWTSSIASIGQTVQQNPTEESLKTAGDDVKSATETLSDDLKNAGTPDTESGSQAKDAVDQLTSNLDDGLQKIETAIEDASGVSGALTAVSTVSSTLATMGNQVVATFQQLEQIDAHGELNDAFGQADACAGVTSTGS
jgi:methyl-accepting chemotaxis protein